MENIVVGIQAPDKDCPSSYYRGWGPWIKLTQKYPVQLKALTEFTWRELKDVDVVFMQRPWAPEHVQCVINAFKNGSKVWCDWDDNLFCVPTDNPQWHTYNNCADELIALAARSSLITVSTQVLLRTFSQYNRNVVVVPNGIDTDFYCNLTPPSDKLNKRIVLWRGSSSNIANIHEFAEPLIRIIRKCTGMHFVFQGHLPYKITDNIPKDSYTFSPWTTIPDCLITSMAMQPSIAFVTLRDTPFERSRSNIAWMESTMAGAAVLAPDFEEWQQPGITRYKDTADFEQQLVSMLNMPDEQLLALRKLSRGHVRNVNDSNEQRFNLLKALASGSSKLPLPSFFKQFVVPKQG
jgi:hypothetical protein